jgi:hypothetical protein
MQGRLERLVAVLVLTIAVSACSQLDGDKNEARISNTSGEAVNILWTAPSAEDVPYAVIQPGQAHGLFEWVGRCAPNAMVARTADGREIIRSGKPLCPGEVWVIPPGQPVTDFN